MRASEAHAGTDTNIGTHIPFSQEVQVDQVPLVLLVVPEKCIETDSITSCYDVFNVYDLNNVVTVYGV